MPPEYIHIVSCMCMGLDEKMIILPHVPDSNLVRVAQLYGRE